MEEKVTLNVEALKNDLCKIQFSGKRYIDKLIDNWLEIRHVINNPCEKLLIVDDMTGEISAEGICLLVEMLSEYDFYRHKKIAIVLPDKNSYSSHFFDVYAKNWGINTKHFDNETDAVNWLL